MGIMERNVKRFQNKNAHTKMFQNATMSHKSIAIPIPFQNATKFPNNTVPRNTKRSATKFQLKCQLRSKKASVSGPTRDTVMMMIIVNKVLSFYKSKAISSAFEFSSDL